ncbi:MAG: carboxylesterase/lipase family protein [Polyangiales bacterium]
MRRYALLLSLLLACDSAPRPLGALDAGQPSLDASTDQPARDASARDTATRDDSTRGASTRDASTHEPVADPTLIHVGGKPVRGTRVGEALGFFGIRYAEPPVGDLRFAPPQPAGPWQGVLDASSFVAQCPQAPTRGLIPGVDLPESEDCLRLHVWTPARRSDEKLPVMFFIHGGRFTLGSGADLDGQHLAVSQNVIVVAINYRLGPLGWIVHPSLDQAEAPSGNYGLRDQQMALHWVKQHIVDFGGDPESVTLFGQSAGSQSACYHLFARGSEGTFQRIILESGTCVDYPALPLDRGMVQKVGELIANELCPDDSEVAACLRALPPERFTDWVRPGLPGPMGEDFNPQVDGKLLPEDPWRLLAAGQFQKVPMIVGTTIDEWGAVKLYDGADAPRPSNQAELLLVSYGLYPNEFADILALYAPLGSQQSANDTLGRITSDSWFHCPARTLARGAAKHGVPVYLYSFTLAPSVHGQELDYVFGYPWLSGLLKEPTFSPPAPLPLLAPLRSAVQTYWASFARTGVPSDPSLQTWPAYGDDVHLELGRDIQADRGLYAESCDFWDAVFAKRHAAR